MGVAWWQSLACGIRSVASVRPIDFWICLVHRLLVTAYVCKLAARRLCLYSITILRDTVSRCHMKEWFDSANLIENASVDIGFVLNSEFYYGPDQHPAVVERKEVERLRIPLFARSTERFATTSEAEPYIDQLIIYYSDVVRLAKKHGKTFNQICQYFWLRLSIFDKGDTFRVGFPWYDTLSEMQPVLVALSNPPSVGEVHWDRDQGWELEMDSYNGLLYVREWDPDYDEVHVVAKLPLRALASSAEAALHRTQKIISALTKALSEDAWTDHKPAPTFSKLKLPI